MWIMRLKSDGLYFVKRRGDSDPLYGTGDLMTDDPNQACLYNVETPAGFRIDIHLWESVPVDVQVTIK